MSLLRAFGNFWLGITYRRQEARRLDQGIHRASAVGARSCGNCCHASRGGTLVYRRCATRKLVVHRGDICRKFSFRSEA